MCRRRDAAFTPNRRGDAMIRNSLLAILAVGLLSGPNVATALPIVASDVSFDSDTGRYTYSYTIFAVDPGRKVTGHWMGDYRGCWGTTARVLPLSWDTPFAWNFLPGHDGPIAGGVWMSNTGSSNGDNRFRCKSNWGILLSGQTRSFSFVTGYAPRVGTYFLTENADGSEVGYNFLEGTTIVPDYSASLVETRWIGQDTMDYPPGAISCPRTRNPSATWIGPCWTWYSETPKGSLSSATARLYWLNTQSRCADGSFAYRCSQ